MSMELIFVIMLVICAVIILSKLFGDGEDVSKEISQTSQDIEKQQELKKKKK